MLVHLAFPVAPVALFAPPTLHGSAWSQVDKVWSIVPFVYTWHFWAVAYIKVFACRASLGNTDNQTRPARTQTGFSTRLFFMAILTTLWGTRLSYNFARKGG